MLINIGNSSLEQRAVLLHIYLGREVINDERYIVDNEFAI